MATFQSPPPLSLLIVEDDKTACEIIARMVGLEFPDCTIYTAGDGVKGLELFKEHAPDIVITDVNLPAMNGVELVREIRSIKADATYIVVTAYSDKAIFKKFQDTGVCAYLLKPINFNELFAAIERCCYENKPQQG